MAQAKQTYRIRIESETAPDGKLRTRKLDPVTGEPRSEWTVVEPPPQAEEPEIPPRELSIVAHNQAEGEPKHWALFSHRPNPAGAGNGQVWQVTGDAEKMYYQHDTDTDILDHHDFAWHQILNKDLSDSQFAIINRITREEPPPCAINRAAVTENCQGWAVRVLSRLVGEGVVEQKSVDGLRTQMDPV